MTTIDGINGMIAFRSSLSKPCSLRTKFPLERVFLQIRVAIPFSVLIPPAEGLVKADPLFSFHCTLSFL